ncbi:MAG: hypothetical protein ACFFCC_06600 [Promethearchaeota archaeon]
MARKGAIRSFKKGNQKLYSVALFILGMFDFQVNKLTRDWMKR